MSSQGSEEANESNVVSAEADILPIISGLKSGSLNMQMSFGTETMMNGRNEEMEKVEYALV